MPARRHLHLLIALLLPLMVVRGMLPAGFMPVAQDGQLRMQLCSDGLQLPTIDHDSGKRDSGDHDSGGPDTGNDAPGGGCLFAHAAASAPPPSPVSLTRFAPVRISTVGAPASQRTPGVIARAQTSRGPPALQ